jgi:Strictosidine synthase
MARPQPRNKGGGVPPPLRPKDASKLRERTRAAQQQTQQQPQQQTQQHTQQNESGEFNGSSNGSSNGNGAAHQDPQQEERGQGPSSSSGGSQRYVSLPSPVRTAAALVAIVWVVSASVQLLHHRLWGAFIDQWLLPWGSPAVPNDRLRYAAIDKSNDALQLQHRRLYRIVERGNDKSDARKLATANATEPAAEPAMEPLLKAPETILFDPRGNLLIMTEESQLVMLSDFQHATGKGVGADTQGSVESSSKDAPTNIGDATVTAVATHLRDLGPGRPLGGAFGHGKFANTLYIADAVLGLTRIRNYNDPKSKVEIVAASVEENDSSSSSNNNNNSDATRWPSRPRPRRRRRRRLKYVDDVVVGRRTNRVYFTDASNVAPDRVFRPNTQDDRRGRGRGGTWTWDTLHASKVDLLLGATEGRVYQYDPSTDRTTELGRGFRFANGISVDPDENFLVVAETFGPKIHKYWLRGDKAGRWDVLLDSDALPGYPDGVDCEPTGNRCYAVLPSSIVPVHKALSLLPRWFNWVVRTVLLRVPRQLVPPTQPYAGVLVMDAETGAANLLQDPTGRDVSMLCGVTYHKGKLYLGSVHNNYIAVYDTDDKSSKGKQ